MPMSTDVARPVSSSLRRRRGDSPAFDEALLVAARLYWFGHGASLAHREGCTCAEDCLRPVMGQGWLILIRGGPTAKGLVDLVEARPCPPSVSRTVHTTATGGYEIHWHDVH